MHNNTTTDIEQYERFFEVNFAGFLLADIYAEVYKNIGFLAINFNSRLGIFLKRKGTKESRDIGRKMYSEEGYKEYIKDFDIFINNFDFNFKKITSFGSADIEYFFRQVIQFLNLYRYTEFFYTDYIFDPSYKDKYLIQQSKVGAIKSRGRLLLNKIFLEEKGYLSIVLSFLSKKFSYSKDVLFNFSHNELINVGNGRFPNNDLLKDRGSDYYLLASGTNKYFNKNIKDISNFAPLSLLDKDKTPTIIQGLTACLGKYIGKARVIEPDYSNHTLIRRILSEMRSGEVLIAESTSPDIVMACKLAGAIVTNQGGMGSHAAIISREMNVPCIVGTQYATQIIKTGDIVIVDGYKNEVRILESR